MKAGFIQTMQEYRQDYEAAKGLGAAMLACNGMLVPQNAPHLALLCKSFPRPIVTNTDSADVAYAGGLAGHVAGVPKTSYEGSLQLIETEKGIISDWAQLLVDSGGTTNCIYYDGRVNRWTKAFELIDCAITLEAPDMDAESRSQIVMVTTQMRYMYFGQNAAMGNVSATSFGGTMVNMGGSDLLTKAQNILNVAVGGKNLATAIKNLF